MRENPYYACGPCAEYEMTSVSDIIDLDSDDIE